MMRKIILQLATSLDGFIEGPRGEYDWCFTDRDYGMVDFLKRIDTLFLGRKTYEMMKDLPVNPNDPFTTSLAQLNQYVFSNSLDAFPEKSNYQLVNKDQINWIKNFKETAGRDVWLFGGAALTASLFNDHLIDELILAVHPVVLGSGKTFAPGLNERVNLAYLHSISYDTGLIMMKYAVK